MMNIFKVQGFYLVADPDTVEQKNLANQLFIPKDVGQKKAAVLANRTAVIIKCRLLRSMNGTLRMNER
ncbi:hypothetical protein [Brevibacillus thermoruber]|uniref:hypothetical protein n=1 Tax=Brevibacillus thermoruber TaxID=33942 RepID=UPI000A70C97B